MLLVIVIDYWNQERIISVKMNENWKYSEYIDQLAIPNNSDNYAFMYK